MLSYRPPVPQLVLNVLNGNGSHAAADTLVDQGTHDRTRGGNMPSFDSTIDAVVTSLLTTVATDSWGEFKRALSRILGRGDDQRAARHEDALDEDHDALIDAQESGNDQRVTRIRASWEERLIRLIEQEPDSVEKLAVLAERFAPPPTPGSVNVSNLARDRAVLGSSVSGNVNMTVDRRD